MKHSPFLFKKFVFVLCFFVLQSLSAMINDVNKRINEQTNADMNYYSDLTEHSNDVATFCNMSITDNTGMTLRCWFVSPKIVVLSMDTHTNHINLVYDDGIQASGESISKSFDEIMETHNIYPGRSLNIDSSFSAQQVFSALNNFRIAVILQTSNGSANLNDSAN